MRLRLQYLPESKSNIVLLLAKRALRIIRLLSEAPDGEGRAFKIVRLDGIIDIGSVALCFLARWFWRDVARLGGGIGHTSNFAKLPSPVNVRQTALFIRANSCVSIVWTFSNMASCAIGTLFAVTKDREIATDVGGRVDLHMSITASGIRAVAAREMDARWGSIGGGIMGKLAVMA